MNNRTGNAVEQWNAIELQHQFLFRIIEQLEAELLAGRPRAELSGLLDQLARYVVVHFTSEEALMAHTEYPDLAAHRREHESTRLILVGLEKEFTGGDDSAAGRVLQVIRGWAATHIPGADRKLCDYILAPDEPVG